MMNRVELNVKEMELINGGFMVVDDNNPHIDNPVPVVLPKHSTEGNPMYDTAFEIVDDLFGAYIKVSKKVSDWVS